MAVVGVPAAECSCCAMGSKRGAFGVVQGTDPSVEVDDTFHPVQVGIESDFGFADSDLRGVGPPSVVVPVLVLRRFELR